MAQTTTSQLGSGAIAHAGAETSLPPPTPAFHHLTSESKDQERQTDTPQITSSQLGPDAVAHSGAGTSHPPPAPALHHLDAEPSVSDSQDDTSRTATSQLGSEAIAHHGPRDSFPPAAPALHHLSTGSQSLEALPDGPAAALPTTEASDERDLEFGDLPPFPSDVSTAPLLRIKLDKLRRGEEAEVDRLWKACCELGFFYLDLREQASEIANGIKSPEQDELSENVWKDHAESQGGDGASTSANGSRSRDVEIDSMQLLKDVDELFSVGHEVFDLPAEEKVKYDFKAKGSYFGYKGYGDGVIDAKGTKDRNEFYNVSKDDILGISEPLPAPEVLKPHRDLLRSYMQQSHSIVSLILRLLNARLDLPPDTLPSKHRMDAVSGDQVRWVHAPPQPIDDRKTALGEHTDFGSVTVLFNRLGGLQVLPPDTTEWCYVKPLKGHAVVNLGDAMVKFTAGVLRSNMHRVSNPPGEQADSTRMSLVYFARPEDDVILNLLEGSRIIDQKKSELEDGGVEEEITAKDWILRRALGRRTGGDWNKSGGTERETATD